MKIEYQQNIGQPEIGITDCQCRAGVAYIRARDIGSATPRIYIKPIKGKMTNIGSGDTAFGEILWLEADVEVSFLGLIDQ